MRRLRNLILTPTLAVAVLAGPAAAAQDAAPEHFVIPAVMAPVHLARGFPLRLRTTEGELTGTAALLAEADGAVRGTIVLGASTLSVEGRQRFAGRRGTLRLVATGAEGTLTLNGKLRNATFDGSARGTAAFAAARGFAVDVLLAPPLQAVLDLDVTTDSLGRATATGEALVGESLVSVEGAGKRGKKLILSLAGEGFTARVTGKPGAAGGYLCKVRTTGYGARGAASGVHAGPIAVDVTAGAYRSTGETPALASITFQDATGAGTVQAYAGRVVVFVDPAIAAADAGTLFSQHGGTVVAAIPAIGTYVATVGAGFEATFIAAMRADARVRIAMPDVELTRGSAEVYVVDDCGGPHGDGVVGAFRDEGGTGARCLDDGGSVPNFEDTIAQIAEAARRAGTNSLLLNISTYGRSADEWRTVVEFYLAAIAGLTPQQRDRLVLTICAGNQGRDVAAELAKLRLDPQWAEILDENVLIVGAVPEAANSNTAPGDPAFVFVPRCDAPTGGCGTSYAAPRALAVIQRIMAEKKLSARLALRAAKVAAGAQEDQVLLASEALDVAQGYRSVRPTISVAPASFAFTMTEGGAAPATQTLTVTNTGAGASTLRFAVAEYAPWLALDGDALPLDAGESAEFELLVDGATLRPGRSATFLLVRDDAATKPVVRVPVTVDVAPGPASSLTIASVNLVFVEAGQNYRNYQLTASGTVSGPVGSTLAIALDTDGAPTNRVTVVADWGDPGSSSGRYRDEGEPKSSTWTYTATVQGDDVERTVVTLHATVVYFPKSGDPVELEVSQSADAY